MLKILGLVCLVAGPCFWNVKSHHSSLGGFGPSSTVHWGRLITIALLIAGAVLIFA